MKKQTIIFLSAACVIAAVAGLWWCAMRSDSTSSQPRIANGSGTAKNPSESQITVVSEQGVSDTVHSVISKDTLEFSTRRKAVKSLSQNLTSVDLTALMDFMNGERPESCPLAQWHALVDNIINVLRRQENPPPGLTQSLIHMYRDNDDVVLKDYSIQYLRSWYVDRENSLRHETDPSARDLILQTLVHASGQTTQSYSGTALMALFAVISSPAFKKEPITQQQIQSRLSQYDAILLAAAQNSDTHKNCRISALQICAIRGLLDVLPTARALAADPTADTNLRISAIAAIGQLGNHEEDRELLKTLEKEGYRLASATQPALGKLSR